MSGEVSAAPRGRFAERLVLAAAALAVLSYLVVEVYDLDVFWNVAIGRDILARLSVPRVDRYTVAGLGHPYHDIHWLFQVTAALAWRLAGWIGVELVAVAAWGAALLLVFRATARRAAPAAAAALVFVAAMASAERFLPRPELATVLGLALFLERLDAGAFRSGRGLALLAVAELLWSNAHGLFVLGPALVGAWLAVEVVRQRGFGSADARALARLLAATLAASVLTPYGWRSWDYARMLVVQVGPRAPKILRSLGELGPTFGESFRGSPAFWFFLALLVAAAALLVAALLRRRPLPAELVLVGGAMAGLAMTGRRNVILFALVAPPLVAALAGGPLRVPSRLAPVLAAAMLAWGGWAISGRYYLEMEIPARVGFGVTPSFFPHALPAFLDRIAFRGNVWNSNTIGGFYMFHGFPARLPLTEGRWTAYEDATAERILAAPADPLEAASVVRDFRIEGFLLAHTSPEARELVPRLARDPGWRLVWLDHAASFWLPEGRPDLPPAVSLDRPLAAAPARVEEAILLDVFYRLAGSAGGDGAIENLRRASTFGFRREHFLEERAKALLAAGRESEAESAFRELAARFPKNGAAANELAYFAFRRGDLAEAERLLARALELRPGDPDVAANLERVRAARRPVR